jgi:predicted amidophosphoribosyltransferase
MADRYYNNVFWPKATICPSCGKSARPIHKRMFPPDPERVFCRFCGEEVKLVANRLTNGDKIRAMSDEELADKLWSIAHYEQKKRCISDWLDWLNQEVEE